VVLTHLRNSWIADEQFDCANIHTVKMVALKHHGSKFVCSCVCVKSMLSYDLQQKRMQEMHEDVHVQELHEDVSVQNGIRLLVITHERAAIRMERVTGCFVGLLLSNNWGCEEKNGGDSLLICPATALIVQTVPELSFPSPECFVRVVPRAVCSLCS